MSGVSCRRSSFTLIELLIVVSIIAILAAMLLPALGKARQKAQAVNCRSRIKQSGMILILYSNDYKAWYPPAARDNISWAENLVNLSYSKNYNVLKCPVFPSIGNFNVFGMNIGPEEYNATDDVSKFYKITNENISRTSKIWLLGESCAKIWGWTEYMQVHAIGNAVGTSYPLHLRHSNRTNLFFADGSARDYDSFGLRNESVGPLYDWRDEFLIHHSFY